MPLLQSLDTLSVVRDTVVQAAPAVADTVRQDITGSTGEAVDTLQGFADGFYGVLPKLAVALVVFLLIWGLARGVRSLVNRVTPGPRNSSVGIVLGRLAYAGMLALGVFVAIAIVFPTVNAATLLGGLGIGGVALGFAFQDIFQNLLAGVLILLREPFRVGDEITSGDYTGTVEAIETRATFIRTYDGRRIIIPNSQIYTEPVSVITAYQMVRSEYDIGIGYGDDIGEAKRIVLETVRGIDGVMQDPGPDVLTWDFADSTLNLRVRWWTDPTRGNVVVLRDKVLQAIKEALLGAGIDLPFPTQQILFHDQTEATDGDRTRQREGWPAGDDSPQPARISLALAERGNRDGADESGPPPEPGDGQSSYDVADEPPPARRE